MIRISVFNIKSIVFRCKDTKIANISITEYFFNALKQHYNTTLYVVLSNVALLGILSPKVRYALSTASHMYRKLFHYV